MAIIKKTPQSIQAYEVWQKIQTDMCYLMPQICYHNSDDVDFLKYALDMFYDRIKVYSYNFCKPCKNCGRPTNDVLLCSAKDFKEKCEPKDDEHYSFEQYFKRVDTQPDDEIPKLSVEDIQNRKKDESTE